MRTKGLIWDRPGMLIGTALFVIGQLLIFEYQRAEAGNSGVIGGCGLEVNGENGGSDWLVCEGENLPMWYSSSSGNYNEGDVSCGRLGNVNCGYNVGTPSNE